MQYTTKKLRTVPRRVCVILRSLGRRLSSTRDAGDGSERESGARVRWGHRRSKRNAERGPRRSSSMPERIDVHAAWQRNSHFRFCS